MVGIKKSFKKESIKTFFKKRITPKYIKNTSMLSTNTFSTESNFLAQFSANTIPKNQLASIKGAELTHMIIGWDQEEL
ncbi:MAG: hypothetical protein AB8B69_07275 [Chitinophagales bacterium]